MNGNWLQDVYMGESNRGMQDRRDYLGNTEIGEAQRQLRQLRGQIGALSQIAQGRFGNHAPLQKELHTAYLDSSQIGISATGTFPLTAWGGSALPQITGTSRVYSSFKPEKVVITEVLLVTFTNTTLGPTTTVAAVRDAADLVLISAFSGAINCFPNAPNESNGIPAQTFSNNALGVGISWPTVNPGIDVTVGFAVEQSAIFQATPPAGYTSNDISQIVVKMRMSLLGPAMRA